MSQKEMLVVVGDRGGWNALELPLQLALDAGCRVRVYLTATCAEQFVSGKLHPDERMEVSQGSSDFEALKGFFRAPKHHLTVIGASQSSGGTMAGWNATLLSRFVPRLGVQDMYGSIMPMLRRTGKAKVLNCLCVTDEFSRGMILQEFPRSCDQVVVTGGPQFDKTVKVKENWQEERRKLRQLLQVADTDAVFLVAGGLNGTDEMLDVLYSGIQQAGIGANAKIILRDHPRATAETKARQVKIIATIPPEMFLDVSRDIAAFSEDLLPGVDFVLSGYSTTNYYGILYGMPGVVYIGTPAFKRDLMAEKGLECPPEVEAGGGWYVKDGVTMGITINAVLQKHPVLKDVANAQKRIASCNDGHAAERVWQEMQKLMAN